MLQLSVILIAAKIGGEIFERWLKQPSVLGELLAGVAIGPFALGGLDVPMIGAMFGHVVAEPGEAAVIPVSTELWAVAQIGAVILLFYAGLETDFRLFFRYSGPAFVVGMGGVILPFLFGDLATVFFGLADHFLDPEALFIGTIMTATSVGITARVLGDIHKLDTAEGVTILAAAVIDDVLGIIVLAVVASLGASGQVSLGELALIGGKAMGFWIGLMLVGIALSGWISRFLSSFRSDGAAVALALALAFLAAAVAERFGLAMIIGAYTMGLALSNTDIAESLREPMDSVFHALVPIFFVVMGMLVNFPAMGPVIVFGFALSVLAIIGKVFGCGLPALAVGFNALGATRIGLGMMPRGEVALIVAGVGLSSGVIQQDIFGVAIMMTFVTTVLAPVVLVPAFQRRGTGKRRQPIKEVQPEVLSEGD
ncbi:MAG: cation:proton antiporter [Dehalococcoidales bacterium]|nr:cation:proton antiporter [Dehalococcoidales bacterium]